MSRDDQERRGKSPSGRSPQRVERKQSLCNPTHQEQRRSDSPAEGWMLVGGKGDHEKFKHPQRPGHVVVPHPRKNLAVGTLRNI